jgi:imidazolonepropionase
VADLVVEHIGELVTVAGDPAAANDTGRDAGAAALGLVHDAAVAIRAGRVVFAGASRDLPADLAAVPRLDAGGRLVTPGLVDPHTHLVFAGSRAHEFDLRNQGRPYLEIQQAGGGILSTVRATNAASDAALTSDALARLDRFLAHGVTAVEAKTGYALSLDGEARLLDLTAALRRRHPVDISPTLLAHVPPPDGDRDAFVRDFAGQLIPRALAAEAVDVYCDAGAFTLAETRFLLEAARAHKKRLRIHAEQFTHTGAAALAATLGAASVEHLEQLDADDPARLAAAGVVCNVLPGAALTLRLPWPDAGRLYAAGCTVALGTDCNPGSCLSESQPLMMSLACTQMGLSAAQAWLGVTRAAARALGRADAGQLAPGARGDLVLWDADDYRQIPQHLGATLVRTVVVGGAIVWSGGRRAAAVIEA